MKRESFAVLILILISTSAPLNAEELYLCVPDQATGFSFDESLHRWKSVNLVAEDVKFIIRRVASSQSAISIGSTKSNYEECRSNIGFVSSNETYFKCIFGEFLFNRTTGRFIRTYTAGYIDGHDNKENTPAILIGRCRPYLDQ